MVGRGTEAILPNHAAIPTMMRITPMPSAAQGTSAMSARPPRAKTPPSPAKTARKPAVATAATCTAWVARWSTRCCPKSVSWAPS